ncbi:dihydrofolate reductase family protein [Kineococcus sp. SYSU DK018]|uniref:dihydrofolate reductase family protein n=1 Tax=Kineococcus sp. SYSU DK018 TaxID=3383139 RepID=UPI003D7D0AF0
MNPPTPAPFTGAVFIATSLDGFIARPDGDLRWLTERGEDIGETGYDEFIAGVDHLVVGRGTYEKTLSFDEWPYGGRQVLVLSSRLEAEADPRVQVVPDLDALVAALTDSGARRVYVDGGRTVTSMLAAGLVHELTITTAPVLLGEGLPLFGHLPRDVALEHRTTTVLGAGFVQSTYAVVG